MSKLYPYLGALALGATKDYFLSQGMYAKRKSTTKPYARRLVKRRRSGKFSRTKSRYTKRTSRRRVRRQSIYKQLRDVRRTLKSDQARHTHRTRVADAYSANTNGCSYNVVGQALNTTNIEAAMQNLRYYNPSVPGTLVTADASTGTYARQIHFESVYQKLTVKNNYQVPAKVTIISFMPKKDTNNTPTGLYSSGITDQTISGSATSPLSYITDIDMVTDTWKVVASKSRVLLPGREMHMTHRTKPFDYDPSVVDTQTNAYQRQFQAQLFVIRVEGVIAHDSTLSEHTSLTAAVDVLKDTKFVMTYDAGVNLNDYSYNNAADASFTNSGLVSSMPVSDNITYSVS